MKLLHSINSDKLAKMQNGNGFIAALDQSGGSTPKALKFMELMNLIKL